MRDLKTILLLSEPPIQLDNNIVLFQDLGFPPPINNFGSLDLSNTIENNKVHRRLPAHVERSYKNAACGHTYLSHLSACPYCKSNRTKAQHSRIY